MSYRRVILVNEEITKPTVRVLTADYQEVGIMPIAEAIKRARSKGRDLVLVAPNSNPPICRMLHPDGYKRDPVTKEFIPPASPDNTVS